MFEEKWREAIRASSGRVAGGPNSFFGGCRGEGSVLRVKFMDFPDVSDDFAGVWVLDIGGN